MRAEIAEATKSKRPIEVSNTSRTTFMALVFASRRARDPKLLLVLVSGCKHPKLVQAPSDVNARRVQTRAMLKRAIWPRNMDVDTKCALC